MKSALLPIVAGVMLSTSVGAQVFPAATDISQVWKDGEQRIYNFFIDSINAGQLEVRFDGGDEEYSFSEKLTLRLSAVNRGQDFATETELKVDRAGHFLEIDGEARAGEREGKIEARYDRGAGKIVIKKADGEDLAVDAPQPLYAIDDYMIDQIDLALATHEFAPGRKIDIPCFSPQKMYQLNYEFIVNGKRGATGNRAIDSVWEIAMIQPSQWMIYYDNNKRLIKVIDEGGGMFVNLAAIKLPPTAAEQGRDAGPAGSFRDKIPIYGLYLAVAFLGVLFLGKDGLNNKWAYALFALGAASYLLTYVIHNPVQSFYGREVLNNIQGTPGLAGIPPALFSGIYHEGVKLLLLIMAVAALKPKLKDIVIMAVFIGAGYGVIEASLSESSVSKFLAVIFAISNVMFVLFHIAAAWLIGYGVVRKRKLLMWILASLLHFIAVYVWVFIDTTQSPAVTLMAIRRMSILVGVYQLIIFGATFILMLRSQQLLAGKRGK